MSSPKFHEIDDYIHINYKYSMGGQSPFFFALLEDPPRIRGTKCPKCGITYLPPRTACGKCYSDTEWIDLPDSGEIKVSTITWMPISQFVGNIPFGNAFVKVDGTNTSICTSIFAEHLLPSQVASGARVRAVFKNKEQRSGKISDFFFVPENEWSNWIDKPDFCRAANAQPPSDTAKLTKMREIVGSSEGAKKAYETLASEVKKIAGNPKAENIISAEGWVVTVQFNLDNGSPFHLVISDGKADVREGAAVQKTHEVMGDGESMLNAITGNGDFTHSISREELIVTQGRVIDLIRLGRALTAARKKDV